MSAKHLPSSQTRRRNVQIPFASNDCERILQTQTSRSNVFQSLKRVFRSYKDLWAWWKGWKQNPSREFSISMMTISVEISRVEGIWFMANAHWRTTFFHLNAKAIQPFILLLACIVSSIRAGRRDWEGCFRSDRKKLQLFLLKASTARAQLNFHVQLRPMEFEKANLTLPVECSWSFTMAASGAENAI